MNISYYIQRLTRTSDDCTTAERLCPTGDLFPVKTASVTSFPDVFMKLLSNLLPVLCIF